jgi:hypothetical protein
VKYQLQDHNLRYQRLKAKGAAVTNGQIQFALNELKELTEGWWFRRLPWNNKVRNYVEDDLWFSVSDLSKQESNQQK